MSVTDEALPTGFHGLTKEELYRSAMEDFAIEISDDEKNSKTALEAAFLEANVSWDDYVAQHPEVAPVAPTNVVTSGDVTVTKVEEVVAPVEEEVVIRVAEAPKPNVREKYLIKMTRDNPRFDAAGGLKFTRSHPYALVDEAMADYLLTKEDGFRQATPAELREFYG